LNFNAKDLKEIISLITGNSKGSFILMGFSLGGRIALSLYEALPERIDKMVLLAPDGLKVNFWYWLSTQTWAGNRLFAFTMKYPAWCFGLLKLLNGMKLVNASIFKFVKYYIGDNKARNLLYNRWTCLRKIKPDLTIIKKKIKDHHTPVWLLYGLHDRIILSSVGEKFRKQIEKECRIIHLHAGHQLLHEKHVSEILPALLQ
jgi:pimeloyl-ACP methyl ester carboxylesterase